MRSLRSVLSALSLIVSCAIPTHAETYSEVLPPEVTPQDCDAAWHDVDTSWLYPGENEKLACFYVKNDMTEPVDQYAIADLNYPDANDPEAGGWQYDDGGYICGGQDYFLDDIVIGFEWPGDPTKEEIYIWADDSDVGCILQQANDSIMRARVHTSGLVELCVHSYDAALCAQNPEDIVTQLYLWSKNPTAEKARQLIKLMENPKVQGMLSRVVRKGGSIEMVFVADGFKYTVHYAHSTGEGGTLSFWVRPEGTTGKELVDAFYDTGINGKVDFGSGKAPTYFPAINDGLEFQPYWQEWYEQAIEAALATLH